jgi:hypothetical protein
MDRLHLLVTDGMRADRPFRSSSGHRGINLRR